MSEQVLVIPTRLLRDVGLFQGLTRDVARYAPLLDSPEATFLPRALAEEDPGYKQLIPYVVLKWRGQVFHYVRGKGGGETRLHARVSIGIGGHINPADGTHAGQSLFQQGLRREVEEEVCVASEFQERCIGFINDDATPVGQVHLGVVVLYELSEPRVSRREPQITRAGFVDLRDLHARRAECETWSQFVLDYLSQP